MRLIPTILCGGAGSRLWPVSRELHPKPFIRLADGQSLLQKAFLRGARAAGRRRDRHRHQSRALLQDPGRVPRGRTPRASRSQYILEPFGRGTAAAVACGRAARRRTPRPRCRAARPARGPPDYRPARVRARRGARRAARCRGAARHLRRAPGRSRDRLRLHRGVRRGRGAVRGEAAARQGARVRGLGSVPVELGHVLLRGRRDPRGDAGFIAPRS